MIEQLLTYVAPTVFTAIVGWVAWDIKSKLTSLVMKLEVIDSNIADLRIGLQKVDGDLKLEVANVERKSLEKFASKDDIRKHEIAYHAIS